MHKSPPFVPLQAGVVEMDDFLCERLADAILIQPGYPPPRADDRSDALLEARHCRCRAAATITAVLAPLSCPQKQPPNHPGTVPGAYHGHQHSRILHSSEPEGAARLLELGGHVLVPFVDDDCLHAREMPRHVLDAFSEEVALAGPVAQNRLHPLPQLLFGGRTQPPPDQRGDELDLAPKPQRLPRADERYLDGTVPEHDGAGTRSPRMGAVVGRARDVLSVLAQRRPVGLPELPPDRHVEPISDVRLHFGVHVGDSPDGAARRVPALA
ncbi:hypothetical protein THAOC_03924, partial [Thalassiosira oceanica]